MSDEKIARINELAAKHKAEGLTESESAERDVLRKEFLASIRENVKAQLDNIRFVDEVPEDTAEKN
ncbi:MAG: DUF896 domain-containing protein [Eubacteriaceae bacterium]|nr:DUF896 domain-containing protein [Eubacteriaceae bacterium]